MQKNSSFFSREFVGKCLRLYNVHDSEDTDHMELLSLPKESAGDESAIEATVVSSKHLQKANNR